MATLSDLQTRAKRLSDIVSRKVAEKAPIKTGRLRRALRKANTFDTMIDLQKGTTKTLPVKGIELSIDYSPDDAPYGMWWNDPTLSRTVANGRTKNIPDSINFAEKALADSATQKALDELADVISEMIATNLAEQIEDLDK